MDRWSTDEYTEWIDNGTPLNENVSQIALGFMDITELPDSIDNLPNLEAIVCPTTITAIPSSVSKLKKLQWLNLSGSLISTLPEELRNFRQNIKINVENTPLWRNPPAQLQTWPSNIIFVPPLFGQPRIKSIKKRLTDNYSFTYPEYLDWVSIGSPINKQVGILDLDQDYVDSVPITAEIMKKIYNLKDLEKLYIKNAEITELPSTIVSLTNLRYLEITNTSLKTLPTNIGNLNLVEFLILENTYIETLPESIGNLENLRVLNLINTELKTLPSSIGKLNKLGTLNLDYTKIERLPEELKNIIGYMPLKITIAETPMETNTYGSQLRSWPSKFTFEPLPAEQAPTPLVTKRGQVNPYVKAKDIISVNEDESVKELLKQKYKIFMCRGYYYATSLKSLLIDENDPESGYIDNPENEYYICDRLADGRFQRTESTPLISTNIITEFQGFVDKAQLLTALNSENNYFELSEQGEDIVVIKGPPNPYSHKICEEAKAKKYDIKVIDVIDSRELMSKLKMKTDFSDVFTDIESDNEEDYRNTFKDVNSDNEEVYRKTFKDVNSDNAGGGRTRRVKRTNKRRTVKRGINKRRTVKRRSNKRKTKKR